MTELRSQPIFLTVEGRERLEQRLRGYLEQLQTLVSPPVDEAEDSADQSVQLEGSDDRSQLADMISALQHTLDRARPVDLGPDDGVVRLGSTVTLRDARGEERRVQLVDGAEVERGGADVALDSPVGLAIFGRTKSDQVSVRLPSGEQRFTLAAVEPYRPPIS